MSRRPNTSAAMRRAALGFTLIELLVVLIIIAVIIAITLPALGSARRAARSLTTRNMLTQISSAAGVFINDNKRAPGYFSARDMAGTQNLTQGFPGMANIMLELAGGVVADGSVASAPAVGDIKVGPGTTAGTTAWVRPELMGSTSGGNAKVYFAPDAKHWTTQSGGGQQLGVIENQTLRSVVDDFGNPILAWAIDDTAVGQITTEAHFAKVGINGQNDPSARFYWTHNSAFLGATALGTRAYNQVRPATALPYDGSMIGSTSGTGAAVAPPDADKQLCAILGSPSFPYRAPGATNAPTVPASARAPLVLHSAGGDGVYFSGKDRGSKQFYSGYMDYQMSFVKTAGPENPANFYLDKDGKREIFDVTKAFDDIMATGGN